MSNKKKSPASTEEEVHEALSKSEAFIEDNIRPILITASIVVVIILGILGFKNFYIIPQNKAAAEKMVFAQEAFAKDNFDIALNGDEVNDGFLAIMDDYGVTKSADLAAYYAGVCSYKLGKYEDAIKYLKKGDIQSINFQPVSLGLIGDSYVALDDVKTAVGYFEKAAAYDNKMTAPVYLKKAGLAYEKLGQPQKALSSYQTIKDKYFDTQSGQMIDKYIQRVSQ